ncbi:heavy metal-responsive transcriptional regulator [uncultured Arthrobacter sp.]|uniref:heavy metal-responsive transcriptional regulator n=1 Tax=uncultured Arthrobacter sp. TaxID=114050 RepID=UPI00260DBB98|nr:heavy metal-responsive transcriptional regulator [uncultured Arthrobacter sp.]
MRIGEAATAANITTKTIRFYEQAGLLPPPGRTTNGYRSYNEISVNRLQFIRRAQTAGLALAQIRDILRMRDENHTPCAHVAEMLTRQLSALDQRIGELQALRATVAEFQATALEADPNKCDPNRICSLL